MSAAHCAGRLEGWRRSVGLLREWAWLRSSEPLALDAIRDYWGERTGFLFAWQAFYVQALAPPAALGLCIWWRRPKGTSVDDDSAVPVFSLFSVVWALFFSVRSSGGGSGTHSGVALVRGQAIFFVQLWRRKQASHAQEDPARNTTPRGQSLPCPREAGGTRLPVGDPRRAHGPGGGPAA